MDNSLYEQMIRKIPQSRVEINRTIYMQRKGMVFWVGGLTFGSVVYFFGFSQIIYFPYNHYKQRKTYKAVPDYVNGSVAFYERTIPNKISDL